MELETGQHDLAEPELLMDRAEPGCDRQQQDEEEGGRDRGSLKTFDLVAALGQRFGGHVVTGQARDPASDKVGQDDAVVEALHAATVGNNRRGDAEGNDIGQGIEFPTHHRRPLPPSGDAAVQNVEYQGREDQRTGIVNMPDLAGLQVGHGGEYRPYPADGVGEGKPVGQMELANHGQGLGGSRGCHRNRISRRICFNRDGKHGTTGPAALPRRMTQETAPEKGLHNLRTIPEE